MYLHPTQTEKFSHYNISNHWQIIMRFRPYMKDSVYRDLLETQYSITNQIQSMKLKNEYLNNQPQENFIYQTWELTLTETISLEDLVKLFPFTYKAKLLSPYDENLKRLFISKNKYMENNFK